MMMASSMMKPKNGLEDDEGLYGFHDNEDVAIKADEDDKFCSIIKSSIFVFREVFRQCTTQETPECVDSGTNFEQSSPQNMRTHLKFEQNTWTQLIFR